MKIGQRVKIYSKNPSDEYKHLDGMVGTIIRFDYNKALCYQVEMENGEIAWFSDFGENLKRLKR